MDMGAGINHSQPAEANTCPDAVSWGVLARVAGGESVHRPNAAAHPQRQSSTGGADCWAEWQEMGGWPITTLSIHNELLQARTFNWSVHVVLVPNPHRRHIWLEWKQLLEHFPDPLALKREIKRPFYQAAIERILVVKGVPQSEEPRTLLFGFTVWFLLDAVLQKHTNRGRDWDFSHAHTKSGISDSAARM